MKKQHKTKDKEVYELKCKICGKIIRSLSEHQADYNMKIHMITHSKKVKGCKKDGS